MAHTDHPNPAHQPTTSGLPPLPGVDPAERYAKVTAYALECLAVATDPRLIRQAQSRLFWVRLNRPDAKSISTGEADVASARTAADRFPGAVGRALHHACPTRREHPHSRPHPLRTR